MNRKAFEEFERRVAAGKASEQEKIDFLFDWGRESRKGPRVLLEELTGDECWEVRYYALQTMVLDLKIKDPSSADLCWAALEQDPDESVKGMAAGCLGSIYFNSYRKDVARRLKRAFDEPSLDAGIKWGLYDSLRALVGRPPVGWNVPRDELLVRGPDKSQVEEVLLEVEQASP
ncbi:MAG TPA: HEAT repeat domain-containing protein [Thermoanaerobaculia bacterium]|nr:HEAT repeat domain-containing protein [Thermoanaerobaculia bacterium]